MEKTVQHNHNEHTFIYSLSIFFERASYYGFRSLLVLYMIGETIKMPREEAFKIYGWFTICFVLSKIIGAIVGDLIIGNKKAWVLGGIIQAIGIFSLCIPNITGIYIGLAVIVIGNGLFSPNMTSQYGKLYLNKTKLLDSAFAIFYLMINLGSFIGVAIISYIGEKYNMSLGLILAGIFAVISIIFPLLVKQPNAQKLDQKITSTNQNVINILKIITVSILVAIFWTLYEVSSVKIFDIQIQLKEFSLYQAIPASIWSSLNFIFIIPITIIVIFIWLYFYKSQFLKLAIGFISGTIAFAILLLIPDTVSETTLILYLTSLLFLNISEIHIAPILYSILIKYSNPKYLAIIISIAFVPIKLFSLIITPFNEYLNSNSSFTLILTMVVMFLISISLVIAILISKNMSKKEAVTSTIK
ncbi:MFS transporter [Aquimarina aquimarini]|uniref:POT-type proton-dependent oligopeptide transporter n=1 Tax=Aquimarina aquimarini TaxID=1191734 RepID=UPI000D560D23|nr:MFS transporter [Aquimarina aquimarini]